MTTTLDTAPVVTPADSVPGPPQGRWTYATYAAIPDDEQRYEVVDGVLYLAPTPNTSHQTTSGKLIFYLMTHVEFAGLGRVFSAPYDVELAPNVVVQPDVVVVLNANAGIITPSRIVGSPDLLIEIASPSTTGYDRRTKQDTYARSGVPEFWIADPAARTIELLVLERSGYRSLGVFQNQALLPSLVLPGLPVHVAQLFG